MAVAAAGVLLFRVADLWLPLAAGAVPALSATRVAGVAPVAAATAPAAAS
jgi:hypothetical protein